MKINIWNLKILKFFSSLKIKQKIILSLVFVSLSIVISMSCIGLFISRSIITNNSIELTNNYVKQISLNLDERIKAFEDATYIISKQNTILSLFAKGNSEDNAAQRQRKISGLNDTILLSPSIYKYTRYIFIESTYGERYVYKKFGESAIPENVILENKLKTINEVSKLNPIRWLEINGDIVFIRLIVDEKTFEVKGIMYFYMVKSFLNFTNTQKNIISDQNFIIMNNWGNIMYSGRYDISDTSISNMLSDKLTTYNIKNRSIKYNGEKTLVSDILTPKKEWRIICLINTADLFRKDKIVIFLNILIAIVALFVSLVLTYAISKSIVKTIEQIQNCMSEVEAGNFKVRIKPANYDEIGMLGLRFNYMVNQIENLIDSVAQERTAKQKAEFQALQAQINPHFLYNSLGSVKWMANRYGQKNIEKMIDSIITLLKGSINKSSSFQTVSEEMNYIESYIELQKMRYGDAFTIKFEVMPQTLNAVVLGFLLQPLVENSLYHGIDMAQKNGEIIIRSFLREGMLVLQVEDNGVGIDVKKIDEIFSQPEKPVKYKSFNSIGIKIVSERLKTYYGDKCLFSINNCAAGRGVLVEIAVPFTTEFPRQEQD